MKRFIREEQWIAKHYGKPEPGYERSIQWDGEIADYPVFGSCLPWTTLGTLPDGLEVVDVFPLEQWKAVATAADAVLLREYLEQFCHWKRKAETLLYSDKETSDDDA